MRCCQVGAILNLNTVHRLSPLSLRLAQGKIMRKNQDEIQNVLGKFEAGQMDRRSFVQSLGLLGVSTFVANAVMQSPLGATKAFAAIGGPEERAWTLAKAAATKATKKTLTILIPTGSIGNM